jgi:hypothetical protein
MLLDPVAYPEPPTVSIARLVCITVVVLTVLLGGGLLLLLRPEYSNAAIALIGVVIGASFGLVSTSRPRRPPDRS